MWPQHTYIHLHMSLMVGVCLYLSCCLRSLLGHFSFLGNYTVYFTGLLDYNSLILEGYYFTTIYWL